MEGITEGIMEEECKYTVTVPWPSASGTRRVGCDIYGLEPRGNRWWDISTSAGSFILDDEKSRVSDGETVWEGHAGLERLSVELEYRKALDALEAL